MRIVFFGTPEFAVPSLEALLRERQVIAGVVTQPDKPQGRSRSTLVRPPIKLVAEREGIPVLQPERPIGDLFLASLRRLEPELGVVVAYGHVLRGEVLTVPTHGMINVHASLLPRWRGAAPVQHAILVGDEETGVSIMRMEEGLDTGPVFHRVATAIEPEETAGALAARLAVLGAAALGTVLPLLPGRSITAEPQDATVATYASKIERETAHLAWGGDAATLVRQVRAFDPSPGAWTTHAGTPLKLFGARASTEGGAPGTVLAADNRLVVSCGHGALTLREVQPAGRNRLSVGEWVRGRGVRVGERFA
jgi:methionyl-tRNA formyltransferase